MHVWHFRRGSIGVSPQSATVYADASGDPTESKPAADHPSADTPEQSTLIAGQQTVIHSLTISAKNTCCCCFCKHGVWRVLHIISKTTWEFDHICHVFSSG